MTKTESKIDVNGADELMGSNTRGSFLLRYVKITVVAAIGKVSNTTTQGVPDDRNPKNSRDNDGERHQRYVPFWYEFVIKNTVVVSINSLVDVRARSFKDVSIDVSTSSSRTVERLKLYVVFILRSTLL